jgi:16S rRNA (guanine966-N2)-methyltransferase
VRVIAGQAKGRTLVSPKGTATRSATDRIRESLFAILDPVVERAHVLDLFAGAGTLGIEALSRGAADATFVERSAPAIVALRRNVATTGFADRATIIVGDVSASLERGIQGPMDLVFIDPPFADVDVLEAVLDHDGLAAVLARHATVVARAFRKHRPRIPEIARLARVKEIGEEELLFLRYDAAGGGG